MRGALLRTTGTSLQAEFNPFTMSPNIPFTLTPVQTGGEGRVRGSEKRHKAATHSDVPSAAKTFGFSDPLTPTLSPKGEREILL
jgi:hypothetical protein